jgi:hypothetical protein
MGTATGRSAQRRERARDLVLEHAGAGAGREPVIERGAGVDLESVSERASGVEPAIERGAGVKASRLGLILGATPRRQNCVMKASCRRMNGAVHVEQRGRWQSERSLPP